jgi:Uma2 family endonuclease
MSAVMTDSPPTRFKLTVEQYHRMGEAGILGPHERVELIDGELIRMAPIGIMHMGLASRLTRLLVLQAGEHAVVTPGCGLVLSEFTEPQPDFTVLRWRADDYMGKRAHASDALLVIEVSDSSLRYDRGPKLGLYARAGVPEVWIVDVRGERVLVHRGPDGEGGYRERQVLGIDAVATCAAMPSIRIEVGALFRAGREPAGGPGTNPE